MCWFGFRRQARPRLGFNVRERALLVYLYRDWLCEPLFLHAHFTYFFPVRTFSKSLCLSGPPLCPILEKHIVQGLCREGLLCNPSAHVSFHFILSVAFMVLEPRVQI